MDITYAAQRALLDAYGPPSVVITAEGDIIYVNGRTGKYLEPSSGKVNVNVFAMAREGLREELGVAIHNAAKREDHRHRQRRAGQVQRRLDDHQPHGQAACRAGRPAGHVPGGVRGSRRGRAGGRRRAADAPPPAGRPPTKWRRNSAARASGCRPPSRKCRPPRRNSAPPTRSCSPTTRNCRAPTKK